MKKLIILIMVLLMSVPALAACGGSSDAEAGGAEDVSVDSLKTIGDIIALDSADMQCAVYEGNVVYAFQLGDAYYQARASISEEDEQAYFDIDFADEDYEEQQNAIVESLEIEEIVNLNDQMLSQEDLDALVGKTGQELMDEGWTFSGHDLEAMEFWMGYGPFVYTVTFDGEVAEADYETFEDETGTKDMTVKSAVFSSLGDATQLEY